MDDPTVKSPELLEMEDRANTLTHAVGTGVALAGLALLVVLAIGSGDPWKIVSVCIYGATSVLLFAASTLYHSTRTPILRRSFRVVDHISINFLIAGTYTPFLLVNLRGDRGWPLFGAIWGLAILGFVSELFLTGKYKILSTVRYLLMGWIILVALGPLFRHVSTTAVALVFAGGVAYSLGAVFYLFDRRLPFGHAVWHVFVLCASVCHFLSIALGVIPYKD